MEPMATWNPDRQVWETSQADLFSEQLEPYSETFPTAGSMRSGRLWRRPTSAPATAAGGCSSSPGLPTPKASDCGTAGRRAGSGFRPPLPQVVQEQTA